MRISPNLHRCSVLAPAAVATGSSLEVTMSLIGGALDGIVRNSEGQPASAATVTLIPDGTTNRSDFYKMASTDQNGHFTFTVTAPGTYRIYAWEELEP
jgi:hypothetical protein